MAGLAGRFPALQRFQTLRSFVPILIGMAIVGLLAFVQVSSTPQFCGTCHIMKPYYKSWENSAHNKIACVECHISPGLTAEVRKKFEALSMVAKYFTATYGTKPWAEVDDAACLRCHERRLLDGRVEFEGVAFDHRPHLPPRAVAGSSCAARRATRRSFRAFISPSPRPPARSVTSRDRSPTRGWASAAAVTKCRSASSWPTPRASITAKSRGAT